jgi:hypothetical protein
MQETLTTTDLVLKVILGMVGLGVIIFGAGKSWATVTKLLGSNEAIHRRMSEEQVERRLRDKEIDTQLMNIRLDIRALQTWKQTMRFKLPEAEPALFKDE